MSDRKSHWIDDEFWERWRDQPAVAEFEELSPRRQLNVLWSQTKYDGYFPDFQQLMGSASSCSYGRHGGAPIEATLGDDGRFHATRGGHLVCTSFGASSDGRHDMWFGENGESSHHGPDSVRGASRVEVATWPVKLCGESVEPHEVPIGYRCPRYKAWPPTTVVKRASMWTRLIDELGPWCGACNQRAATVDHDHLTGIVRGLLCRDCNKQVDACAHPSGCHYADYLNSPPAAHLAMVYPGHRRKVQDSRRVERMDRLLDTIATEERLAHLRDFVVDGRLRVLGP